MKTLKQAFSEYLETQVRGSEFEKDLSKTAFWATFKI